MRIKIFGGFVDTRTNKEDFALTPYLLLVWGESRNSNGYGIGLCWGWYSVHIVVSTKYLPHHKRFKVLSKKHIRKDYKKYYTE